MFCATNATSCTSDTPTSANGRITMTRQIARVAIAANVLRFGIFFSSRL